MALCRGMLRHYPYVRYGILTKRYVRLLPHSSLRTAYLLHPVLGAETNFKQTAFQRKKLATHNVSPADREEASKVIERLRSIVVNVAAENQAEKNAALQADTAFSQVLEDLQKVACAMTASQFLSALALLLPVYPQDDTPVMASLQHHAQFLMQRHMSVSQLVQLIQLHHGTGTKLHQKILQEAWLMLERRWVEVRTGRDIITLLHCAPAGAEHFLTRLEDRALELCESFSGKELYRVLYALARRQRRNTPLLRALVYHLSHRELDLNTVHLANLAYALASLNMHSPEIMDKIVVSAVSTTKEQASHGSVVQMLSSLAQSFGILRRCDTRLFDAAAAYFLTNKDLVASANWHQLLYACARLGYIPQPLGTSGIIDIAHSISESPFVSTAPLAFLDIVWSCCLFSVVTPRLVSIVLDPVFVSNVIKASGSNVIPVYTKLLNVNSHTLTALSGYDGPRLSAQFVTDANSQIPSRQHDELFNSVFEALSQMAPAKPYLRTDVKTSVGCVIDIEMVINSRAEPQPLSDSGSIDGLQVSPSSLHRVAILLHNFADMTNGTVGPNGQSSFAARLLWNQGFRVIQIPHTEFDVSSTVVKRVQYLHQRLKAAVDAKAPLVAKASDSGVQETAKAAKKQQKVVKKGSPAKNAGDIPASSARRTTDSQKELAELNASVMSKSAENKTTPEDAGSTDNVGAKVDGGSRFTAITKPGGRSAASSKQKASVDSNTARIKLDLGTLFTKEFEENYKPKELDQSPLARTMSTTEGGKKD